MTPVLIIGGILFGLFTATEAAIAASAYALCLGGVVYRTLNVKTLLKVSIETIETTSIIMLIIGAAAVFSWVLTTQHITTDFTQWMLAFTDNKVTILLLMMLNLMIGLLTPPVGMVLYVLSRVTDVPFETCARATLPFLVPLLIVLMLVTFIPALTTWLPSVLYP